MQRATALQRHGHGICRPCRMRFRLQVTQCSRSPAPDKQARPIQLVQHLQQQRTRRHVAAGASSSSSSEPFRPAQQYRAVSPEPDPEPRMVLGLTFSDVCFYVNISYWSGVILSVLTGNELLGKLTHFEHYTTLMFGLSATALLVSLARFARDMKQHLQQQAHIDWREVMRYTWLSVFWAGFVLWYAAPPVTAIAELAGTPGVITSLFGMGISVAAGMQSGFFSFMGDPMVPRRLLTTGVYALLRHPQALGNFLAIIGFSLAGGAVWASAAFALAFLLYSRTVIAREERLLTEAFGEKYQHYKERVPSYAWALVLLLILEVCLMWSNPWAQPIEVTPPPRVI